MRYILLIAALSAVVACTPPQDATAPDADTESTQADADTPTPFEEQVSALPVFRPEGTNVASICGATTDYVDVRAFQNKNGIREPRYVTEHAPSTVMFRWVDLGDFRRAHPSHQHGNVAGREWCTGTLIEPNRVLTAGHCFYSQDGSDGWVTPYRVVDGRRVYLGDRELALLQTVVFDYEMVDARDDGRWDPQTARLREGESRAITDIEFDATHGLDYAIVQFAGVAPDNRAPAQVSMRNARQNDQLIIIQHPGGQPKQIDVGSLLRLAPASAPVEMRYDNIDTIGGSSGSGVRNTAGVVVGVHVAGGCDRGIGNEAVPIEAIRARSQWLE